MRQSTGKQPRTSIISDISHKFWSIHISQLFSHRLIIFILLVMTLVITLIGKAASLKWWVLTVILYSLDSRGKPFIIERAFVPVLMGLLLFILSAVLSSFFNECFLADSLYSTMMRLMPLLFIAVLFRVGLRSTAPVITQKQLVLLIYLLYIPVFVPGLYQCFVQHRTVDNLLALTDSARTFGFLTLFTGLLIWVHQKNRLMSALVCFLSLYLSIIADSKIQIVILASALLPAWLLYRWCLHRPFKNALISTIVAGCIIWVSSPIIITMLPSLYQQNIKLFSSINYLTLIENSESVFPDNLELFKGYIAIPEILFKDNYRPFLGVGPGNFSKNSAVNVGKPLMDQYVNSYRGKLDALKPGIGWGLFSVRTNMFISALVENGIPGFLFWILSSIVLLFIPLKFAHHFFHVRDATRYEEASVFFYSVLFIYMVLSLPFNRVFEAPDHVLYIAVLGSLLLHQLQTHRISEDTMNSYPPLSSEAHSSLE